MKTVHAFCFGEEMLTTEACEYLEYFGFALNVRNAHYIFCCCLTILAQRITNAIVGKIFDYKFNWIFWAISQNMNCRKPMPILWKTHP